MNDIHMIKYMNFSNIEATGIAHAIYTAMGIGGWGLDEPGDLPNYEALGDIFSIPPERMVRTKQLHTNGVRVITEDEAGEGVIRPVTMEGYDGMVTDAQGLMLCTVEADCVPVYLLDPVHKACGMLHSGWKGTAGRISAHAIDLMHQTYGTDPHDIIAAIGPCICRECYEVSEDLLPHFQKTFSEDDIKLMFRPKPDGKYMLDLKYAVSSTLIRCGVPEGNIEDSGYCTYHSGKFYSWRRGADPDVRMLTAIWLA